MTEKRTNELATRMAGKVSALHAGRALSLDELCDRYNFGHSGGTAGALEKGMRWVNNGVDMWIVPAGDDAAVERERRSMIPLSREECNALASGGDVQRQLFSMGRSQGWIVPAGNGGWMDRASLWMS